MSESPRKPTTVGLWLAAGTFVALMLYVASFGPALRLMDFGLFRRYEANHVYPRYERAVSCVYSPLVWIARESRPVGAPLRAYAEFCSGDYALQQLVFETQSLVLEKYPVGDLMAQMTEGREDDKLMTILDQLATTIAVGSWEETGGAGSIREDRKTKTLFIRTYPSVHAEIREQLAEWRMGHDPLPRRTVFFTPPHGVGVGFR